MRVLVTGANGFVGQALLPMLMWAGHAVRAAVRYRDNEWQPIGIDVMAIGDIGPDTDWRAALEGIDGVIHLAGRAHIMRNTTDPLAEYRRVNVEGTRRLATTAHAAGVRRFVFVSSVKVNGERTPERPFTEADRPCPEDAYGLSKSEAEQVLSKCGMETVIVRPPLVYGPGVKGNFLRLLRACDRGIPLPLGAVHNARSLIYVGNLAAALVQVLDHSAAAGQTFLVRDGEDVSVPQLVRRMAASLGRPARLVPVPLYFLRSGAALLGRPAVAARLLDSLTVDDQRIRHALDWASPFTMEAGLAETAAWFRSSIR